MLFPFSIRSSKRSIELGVWPYATFPVLAFVFDSSTPHRIVYNNREVSAQPSGNPRLNVYGCFRLTDLTHLSTARDHPGCHCQLSMPQQQIYVFTRISRTGNRKKRSPNKLVAWPVSHLPRRRGIGEGGPQAPVTETPTLLFSAGRAVFSGCSFWVREKPEEAEIQFTSGSAVVSHENVCVCGTGFRFRQNVVATVVCRLFLKSEQTVSSIASGIWIISRRLLCNISFACT